MLRAANAPQQASTGLAALPRDAVQISCVTGCGQTALSPARFSSARRQEEGL